MNVVQLRLDARDRGFENYASIPRDKLESIVRESTFEDLTEKFYIYGLQTKRYFSGYADAVLPLLEQSDEALPLEELKMLPEMFLNDTLKELTGSIPEGLTKEKKAELIWSLVPHDEDGQEGMTIPDLSGKVTSLGIKEDIGLPIDMVLVSLRHSPEAFPPEELARLPRGLLDEVFGIVVGENMNHLTKLQKAQKIYDKVWSKVPFEEPKWVTKATGQWSPSTNPSVFYDCSLAYYHTWTVVKKLRTVQRSRRNLSFVLISEEDAVSPIMKFNKVGLIISWEGDTASAYIDKGIMTVIDHPRILRKLREILGQHGYEVRFMSGQKYEESCGYFAIIRAMLMTEHGLKGATMPIPPEYAVLVHRLVAIAQRSVV